MTDESVFAQALAIGSPRDRAAFLDRACAGNAALRVEVEGLLAAHAASNPLDQPPADLARTGAYESDENGPPVASVGDKVGPYRLMEQIGEGGFGLVFVAEQSEPVRRKVALKVLKPGMDTKDVVARFEAERQALALMDHPNIARVLDAGSTPQGRPYFVMELVRGVPITEFCDAQKLPPKDRLALFVLVCQAVQHAHQKGVIHRDLKPSNVLVTVIDGVPVPKVIDFGVAKAVGQSLTEKTIYTRFAQMIGTPLYMSPEQAEMSGVDVDTRADVYALGVLLYELLTGSTPFDRDRFRKAGFDEIRRIIREEEAPRPSTRLSSLGATLTAVSANRGTDAAKLAGLLRGELDWVVMRCLEKDRNRRYDSATALAKDVQRYLSGDAVDACPPTLGYRLRKAYRRNRATVLTTGAIFAALLVGFAMSAYLAVVAHRAEADAISARNAEVDQREETAKQRDAAIAAGVETAKQRDETNAALKRLQLVQDQQAADQYVWDMQTVPLAFEAGNIAEVRRLLGRHMFKGPDDRRGFEWYYWDRQIHSELRQYRLPEVDASGGWWVASADGSRIAHFVIPDQGIGQVREFPELTVWDVTRRTVLLKHRMLLKRPEDSRSSSANCLFSADGKRIAVEWAHSASPPNGAPFRLLQVLDVEKRKVLLELKDELQTKSGGPEGSVRCAFSPDGRRFAALCPIPGLKAPYLPSGQVHVWNLDDGHEAKEACPTIDANILAESPFTPDGRRLLVWRWIGSKTGPHPRVRLWDIDAGKEHIGWDAPGVFGALSLSPDGTRVAFVPATRGAESSSVKIWDAASGNEMFTLPLGEFGRPDRPIIARLVFSPEGSRLGIWRSVFLPGASTYEITFWNAHTGKPLPKPQGLGSGYDFKFSPDGRQLAVPESNLLRTWDLDTGRPQLTLRGHVNMIQEYGFRAEGQQLWTIEASGLLKEWDARPRGPVVIPYDHTVTGPRSSRATFKISPDGGRVAAMIDVVNGKQLADGVRAWDTTGKPIRVLVPPPRENFARSIFFRRDALAFSHDGRRLVLLRYGGQSYDQSGKEKSKSISADMIVWDVDSGTEKLHVDLGDEVVIELAIAPDGRTVAFIARAPSRDSPRRIRLFDVESRRERPSLAVPGGDALQGLTFSPNGHRIVGYVQGGDPRGDQMTKLLMWDVDTGSYLFTADAGQTDFRTGETIGRIAWAPDGTRLAFSQSRGKNKAITLYDAITGKPLVAMDQPLTGDISPLNTPPSIAFSPDGKRIAGYIRSGANDAHSAVNVWDAATGKELLTITKTTNGDSLGAKLLTFSGDGHRLVLAESPSDNLIYTERQPTSASQRQLLVTTWDATPVGKSR